VSAGEREVRKVVRTSQDSAAGVRSSRDSAKNAGADAAPAASGFTAGSGPDVVLIHGLGSRWQVFAPILDRLAQTHRVHALDLPGFGAEPADPGLRAGVAGLADWVTEWMLERGIHRPHIVGNSMGGAVALELARRGVAGRVTAFAPSGFGTRLERDYARVLLSAERDLARGLPEQLERALHSDATRRVLLAPSFGHPMRVTPDVAIADMRALAGAPAFDDLREALRREGPVGPNPRVPTVIVWGRRDLVLPFLTQARRARRLYPHATHIALGGAGHLPFSDAPDTCTAIVAGTHPFVAGRAPADARTNVAGSHVVRSSAPESSEVRANLRTSRTAPGAPTGAPADPPTRKAP
jgi:pimeloyl-ACP methyl ester carboxylesterase